MESEQSVQGNSNPFIQHVEEQIYCHPCYSRGKPDDGCGSADFFMLGVIAFVSLNQRNDSHDCGSRRQGDVEKQKDQVWDLPFFRSAKLGGAKYGSLYDVKNEKQSGQSCGNQHQSFVRLRLFATDCAPSKCHDDGARDYKCRTCKGNEFDYIHNLLLPQQDPCMKLIQSVA